MNAHTQDAIHITVAAVVGLALGLTLTHLGTPTDEAIPTLQINRTLITPSEASLFLSPGCTVPPLWPSGELPASVVVRTPDGLSRVTLADAQMAGTLSVVVLCGGEAS